MSNTSQIVRDEFYARFNPVLPRNLETVEPTEEDEEGTKTLVTRKCRRAITNAERKALRDWYFDPEIGKPAHKYVREWFLREFRHTPSKSTTSESLSSTFALLDSGSSRSDVKRQRQPR